MPDSDLTVILMLLVFVIAAYLFPGGPGTPLRMRLPEQTPAN